MNPNSIRPFFLTTLISLSFASGIVSCSNGGSSGTPNPKAAVGEDGFVYNKIEASDVVTTTDRISSLMKIKSSTSAILMFLFENNDQTNSYLSEFKASALKKYPTLAKIALAQKSGNCILTADEANETVQLSSCPVLQFSYNKSNNSGMIQVSDSEMQSEFRLNSFTMQTIEDSKQESSTGETKKYRSVQTISLLGNQTLTISEKRYSESSKDPQYSYKYSYANQIAVGSERYEVLIIQSSKDEEEKSQICGLNVPKFLAEELIYSNLKNENKSIKPRIDFALKYAPTLDFSKEIEMSHVNELEDLKSSEFGMSLLALGGTCTGSSKFEKNILYQTIGGEKCPFEIKKEKETSNVDNVVSKLVLRTIVKVKDAADQNKIGINSGKFTSTTFYQSNPSKSWGDETREITFSNSSDLVSLMFKTKRNKEPDSLSEGETYVENESELKIKAKDTQKDYSGLGMTIGEKKVEDNYIASTSTFGDLGKISYAESSCYIDGNSCSGVLFK